MVSIRNVFQQLFSNPKIERNKKRIEFLPQTLVVKFLCLKKNKVTYNIRFLEIYFSFQVYYLANLSLWCFASIALFMRTLCTYLNYLVYEDTLYLSQLSCLSEHPVLVSIILFIRTPCTCLNYLVYQNTLYLSQLSCL